jgi:hypothetical protein
MRKESRRRPEIVVRVIIDQIDVADCFTESPENRGERDTND